MSSTATNASPAPARREQEEGQTVKISLPLKFQQDVYLELRAEDKLVVLASGLGLLEIVGNLLHSHDALGRSLVIVVGANDFENSWLVESLAWHAQVTGAPECRGLTVVNAELAPSAAARGRMYAGGGIFSITSRILVVDLLTEVLRAETVTGVVVLHAERVTDASLEAFALRLYRKKNRAGFTKAFSDNANALAVGFAPLAAVLRNMSLRRVALCPRFEKSVVSSLTSRGQARVVELEVTPTDAMRTIQTAILECVEATLSELKKANASLVDTEAWNMDNALAGNFDAVVRGQLGPHMHRVSWRTRQLVEDLSNLRALLSSLLTLDAVGFLQCLDSIHASQPAASSATRQKGSAWLWLDAAQAIFEHARRRVYAAPRRDAAAQARRADAEIDVDALEPVLEELPKWRALAGVLDEIEHLKRDEPLSGPRRRGEAAPNPVVLVMCSNNATCRQLREYIETMHVRVEESGNRGKGRSGGGGESGSEEEQKHDQPSAAFMMRRKLRDYIRWKRQFVNVNTSLSESRAAEGAAPAAAAARPPPPNNRRRVRGGGSTAASIGRTESGKIAQYFEKPEELAVLMDKVQAASDDDDDDDDDYDDGSDGDGAGDGYGHHGHDISAEEEEDYFGFFEPSNSIVIHPYDGDRDDDLLNQVFPQFIVLYEPSLAFIRRVEIYRSTQNMHADLPLRVWTMGYGGSFEEQRFLATVRREQDSFLKLIKEHSSMSLVMDATGAPEHDPQDAPLRIVNTRIAGGGRLGVTAEQERVVVDVREFRSSLPSLLHAHSIAVIPCTLTVGDYILSPHIVVERKSLADLISSFRDGRLYTQCKAMSTHYRDPMLLIEFDRNKSFTLEPFSEVHPRAGGGRGGRGGGAAGAGIDENWATPDLRAKLVLLTRAFPHLRIIWSSSPDETAHIFRGLKAQEPEPDPMAAMQVGRPGGAGSEEPEQDWNRLPQEMLAAVPGVTLHNMPALARRAENIRDVANMGIAELEPLVGREQARLIHDFFNRNLRAAVSSMLG